MSVLLLRASSMVLGIALDIHHRSLTTVDRYCCSLNPDRLHLKRSGCLRSFRCCFERVHFCEVGLVCSPVADSSHDATSLALQESTLVCSPLLSQVPADHLGGSGYSDCPMSSAPGLNSYLNTCGVATCSYR